MISLRSAGTQRWRFTINHREHVIEGGLDAAIMKAQTIHNNESLSSPKLDRIREQAGEIAGRLEK